MEKYFAITTSQDDGENGLYERDERGGSEMVISARDVEFLTGQPLYEVRHWSQKSLANLVRRFNMEVYSVLSAER